MTEYAETWIRDGGTRPGTAEFDRLYDAWLDDFERRGVREVGFGYVLLRHPESSSSPEAEGDSDAAAGSPTGLLPAPGAHRGAARPARQPSTAGSAPHLAACLDAHDRQAALDDTGLAALRLTVAGDVTEERHYWPGDDDPTAMLLRQGGGFGRTVSLDTGLAALVGACDGELAVGAIIAALAQLLDVDDAALAAELLPAVRALVDDGMLLLRAE